MRQASYRRAPRRAKLKTRSVASLEVTGPRRQHDVGQRQESCLSEVNWKKGQPIERWTSFSGIERRADDQNAATAAQHSGDTTDKHR